MKRLLPALAVPLLLAPVLALLLARWQTTEPEPVRPPAAIVQVEPADARGTPEEVFSQPEEAELFQDAALSAWAYVEAQHQPGTGLVNSVINYPFATVWDIGSTLAAYYCARELGLLSDEEYDRRMGRALETLQTLRLFSGAAFNKNYQVRRGVPAARNDREVLPSGEGYGWSAIDLGRLLIWLRIIAEHHPQHASAVRAVVDRLDFDRILKEGYLWGAEIGRGGRLRTYQEGRIGYEQYAAAGFSLWGQHADRALRLEENAEPIEVLGVSLYTDRRGGAHLTGEPFFLIGIELGWWSPKWEEVARRVLAAQRVRFERTGQLTMVSEDAIPVAPHFFYYYTLYHGGEEFAVTSLTSRQPSGPRWLSTKASFAWYALLPDPYTWKVLEKIAAEARDPRMGWSSGVYEASGRATGGQNINTAAVVLEAALYRQRRRPLLYEKSVTHSSSTP